MTVVNTKTVIGTKSRNVGDVTGLANVDLLTDFSPLYNNSILEIYIVPRGNNAVFTIQRKGTATTTEALVEARTLVAGSPYYYTIECDKSETYNIQASADQTKATINFTEVK